MGGGKDWKNAKQEVARKFNINESVINSDCTRGLRLGGIEEFKDSIKKNQLKEHLIKIFPNDKETIESVFR